jgi:hypothetical protein
MTVTVLSEDRCGAKSTLISDDLIESFDDPREFLRSQAARQSADSDEKKVDSGTIGLSDTRFPRPGDFGP